jgi:hypothetical protein
MELEAYSKAGVVVEEVFSSIRTVLSYSGQIREEKRFDLNHRFFSLLFRTKIFLFFLYRYEKHLDEVKRSGIKRGAIHGFTMGIMWLLIYSAYALGI